MLLSANPTLNPPEKPGAGPARPVIQVFSTNTLDRPPARLSPVWQNAAAPPAFTEHSYRSFAADGKNSELILFQNVGYSHAEWTYRDSRGQWAAQGQLTWPWGAEYENPQPIRICYPNVALHSRAVHFVGVSDVVEPNSAWRQYKRELTGKAWDYGFRSLFYTWTPDVTRQSFAPWLKIASRERSAGYITPGDLWLARDGAAHIVWDETALDLRLRDKFFPQERQAWALNYAVVRNGKVESSQVILHNGEGQPGPIGHLLRFQTTSEGRLFVFLR